MQNLYHFASEIICGEFVILCCIPVIKIMLMSVQYLCFILQEFCTVAINKIFGSTKLCKQVLLRILKVYNDVVRLTLI